MISRLAIAMASNTSNKQSPSSCSNRRTAAACSSSPPAVLSAQLRVGFLAFALQFSKSAVHFLVVHGQPVPPGLPERIDHVEACGDRLAFVFMRV